MDINNKVIVLGPKHVYVTVNMCNQGIRVFPENFSEYTYSLKWSGNTRIPENFREYLYSLVLMTREYAHSLTRNC